MIKRKRGRRRKCESVQIEPNTSISFSKNENKIKDGEEILFGGMKIFRKDNKKQNDDISDINIIDNPSIDLCEIDIPDERIVIKQKRKTRKKIIEDSDRIYKVLLDWPKTTNLLCWWCCHPFETSPKCIPTGYDNKRERFQVTGNFCSWNCAKSFTLDEFPLQISNLTRLIQKIHGFIPEIISAPPKILLKSFGGSMSIDEYRDNTKLFEKNKPNVVLDEKIFYVKTT